MALRLTVVSDQREALGRESSIVLGVAGGSIGRAHDNDWVLPDPQCYVSAHHARVQFRHGTYYLLDTSTNGVYVNGGAVRISPRNIYPLRDGDRLRLGPYEVAVRIDAEASESEAPEASSIFPVHAETADEQDSPASDIGVALDVQELLTGTAPLSQSSVSRLGPVDAFGQPLSIEDTGLQPLARPARPLALVPPVSKPRREPRTGETTQQRAAARAASPHSVAPQVADPAAMAALCRGAGLDPRRIPLELQSRILHLAGLLLREALVGLKGLVLVQRELRDQAHLDVGREEAQQLALTGLAVEELLLRLLVGHDRHELDAVQWLRDTAAWCRAHEQAALHALPPALAEFVRRLDPRALAHQNGGAEEATQSTGVTARFRSITETAPGGLPHLFAEAFARAFVAEFRRGVRPASP